MGKKKRHTERTVRQGDRETRRQGEKEIGAAYKGCRLMLNETIARMCIL